MQPREGTCCKRDSARCSGRQHGCKCTAVRRYNHKPTLYCMAAAMLANSFQQWCQRGGDGGALDLMLDSTTIHKVAVATGMTCERRSWTRQLDVSVFFLPHGRRTSSPSTDGVATLLQQGHGNLLSGHQAGCTS